MRMGVHYKLDDPSQGSPPPFYVSLFTKTR